MQDDHFDLYYKESFEVCCFSNTMLPRHMVPKSYKDNDTKQCKNCMPR